MYYYNRHARFSTEHLFKAKYIKIKRFSCKLNNQTSEIEFKPIGITYIIYFNKQGHLQEVITISSRAIRKDVYTYNKKNKPICIVSFDLFTNQLNTIINLTYNDKDRIETEVVESINFYQDDIEEIDLYEHTYENNKHIINFSAEASLNYKDIDEYDDWTFEEKVNDCDQVVEFKSHSRLQGFHLWTKFHYSNYGELIHEIELDENSGIYSETLYDKDNYTYKYNNKGKLETAVYECKYDYNEKGHWTKEYNLKNGELIFVIEKTIEYHV